MKLSFKKIDRLINNPMIVISVVIVLFVGYRALLLFWNSFPFNADEAIVGLMARHIIQGDRPIFFYGQAYMGSLDAYLVAFFFKIFGEKVVAIRLLQSTLFLLSILIIYLFVIIAFQDKKMAFYSALSLIFAPVNLIVYSTVSLGGYGEALLLGAISFLLSALAYQRIEQNNSSPNHWIGYIGLIGLLTGIGLWTNAISLTFCVPAIGFTLLFAYREIQRLKPIAVAVEMALLGFLIGSSPWWISLFLTKDLKLVSELTGSAVAVSQTSYLFQVWQHFISFIMFAPTVVMGVRPPWSIQPILPFLVPIIVLFWVIIIENLFRNRRRTSEKNRYFILMLLSTCLLVFVVYIFTSFGNDPSGRYFLPFHFILSIVAAFSLIIYRKPLFIIVLFAITLAVQAGGVIKLANSAPFLTTQFYQPAQVDQRDVGRLIEFLRIHDEMTGYSNYWVSYPLAFLSQEEIISIPVLPYHPDLRYTSRDNRIPAYNKIVEDGSTSFYIITNNQPLQDLLEAKFHLHQIEFRYQEIGDFHVYFQLNHRISPSQLGLYDSYN